MSDGAPSLLLFLLVFIGLWLFNHAQYQKRPAVVLRHIAAYELIRNAMAEAAEDGRPLLLSLGTAGISDSNAMQTVAALSALEYLAEQSIVSTNTPLVTMANPTTLLLAQDIAARPFEASGRLPQFEPRTVRFMGGSGEVAASAYAAGLLDLLDRREVAASFLLGHFGDECVVLGEASARHEVPQVAGSGTPAALALMALTADHLLIGEELFAAGAYLSRRPWHVSGLLAQDSARWIVITVVGVVVVLKTFGLT